MSIQFDKFKKIPVFTQSEVFLGQIDNLTINTKEQRITHYHVAKKKFLSKTPHLLIAPSQIIQITTEKVVVSDNVEHEQIKNLITSTIPETKNASTINADTVN